MTTTSDLRPFGRLTASGRGLVAVGDVHGDLEQLRAVVDAARAEDLSLLLLGDLINRGPDSLGCIRLVLELMRAGRADFLPGNHELRARMWLNGEPLNAKDRSRLSALRAEVEADPEGAAVLSAYLDAIADAPIWAVRGRRLFVHAAGAPEMLTRRAPSFSEVVRGADPLADLAIDGERDPVDPSLNTYRWLDRMPAGWTAYAGHDPSPPAGSVREGAQGARLFHLDAGCGRAGGALQTRRIPDPA